MVQRTTLSQNCIPTDVPVKADPTITHWPTLHIVGKAKGLNDSHRSWVYELVPGVDVRESSINRIGDQIEFYVSEALQELEEKESVTNHYTEQISDSVNADLPVARSDNERDHYITAYRLIWTIETQLHRFVATVLSHSKEGQWWIAAFPNDLQNKCRYPLRALKEKGEMR